MDELNRSAHCIYRCSVGERLLMQEVASRQGLSMSAYIRESVLFNILLECEATDIINAAEMLGPECLTRVREKLRHVERLLVSSGARA